jgi:hypothetical protein
MTELETEETGKDDEGEREILLFAAVGLVPEYGCLLARL